MREIASVFGVSAVLNETDRKNIVAKIKAQETAKRAQEQAEKRKRKPMAKGSGAFTRMEATLPELIGLWSFATVL